MLHPTPVFTLVGMARDFLSCSARDLRRRRHEQTADEKGPSAQAVVHRFPVPAALVLSANCTSGSELSSPEPEYHVRDGKGRDEHAFVKIHPWIFNSV